VDNGQLMKAHIQASIKEILDEATVPFEDESLLGLLGRLREDYPGWIFEGWMETDKEVKIIARPPLHWISVFFEVANG